MLDIPAELQRHDLTLAERPLGQGGQASVWKFNEYEGFLVKLYNPGLAINGRLLADLVSCRAKMIPEDRELLDASTAWPLATVRDGDETVGVIIAEAPPRFRLETANGRPAELQYLVMRDRVEQLGVKVPGAFTRLQISARLAAVLDLFDRYALVHGDISHRNVLWSADPDPAVFILDCDGASWRGEPSPLPLVTTPHWTDPRVVDRTIARPDVDSDRLGLALTFYRTFYQRAGNFSDDTIDLLIPEMPGVPDSIRGLCAASLTIDTPRPSAKQWLALEGVSIWEVGADPIRDERTALTASRPSRYEPEPEHKSAEAAAALTQRFKGLAIDLLPNYHAAQNDGKTAPFSADKTTRFQAHVTEEMTAPHATITKEQPARSAPPYQQPEPGRSESEDAPAHHPELSPSLEVNTLEDSETAASQPPLALSLAVLIGCLFVGALIGYVATELIL